MRCLEDTGVSWLEARVQVSSAGEVMRVIVDELDPAEAAVGPCLAVLLAKRFVPAGCELEQRLHFAVFDPG